MPFAKDRHSTNARGGTEIMKYGLADRIPAEILDKFQIYVSRIEEPLDESKIRIYWAHDLPGDPGADFLRNGGWQRFHKLVFASNWQMQGFINHYSIPWSRCAVLKNCIEPIADVDHKSKDQIRLAYWSTPHRGLALLHPVSQFLQSKYGDAVHLDVYSSFQLYGWKERDAAFAQLFDTLQQSPNVTLHGTVSNEQLRDKLRTSHIMAYPSIWQETSCICLMEAMSAKMVAVHPNYGALYETAGNWTQMYQWDEDHARHIEKFTSVLVDAIENYWSDSTQHRLINQKIYADNFYGWDTRTTEWMALLNNLIETVDLKQHTAHSGQEMFVYKIAV